MNKPNPIENRLLSWKLRAPSPRVKRELFGLRPKTEARATWLADAMRWYAPAMCCLMLTLLIIQNDRPSINRTAMPAYAGYLDLNAQPSSSNRLNAPVWLSDNATVNRFLSGSIPAPRPGDSCSSNAFSMDKN